ncbi:unnamed protein product [Rotaria magnacalcarata]|uniref:Uncharacterized protein n=1 Tax=Rotaria magnacalcarata TaxID=392030 RepID=A0A820AUD9_9BILA|nr:unnamed protein product [Rotaria magnacalcarata]
MAPTLPVNVFKLRSEEFFQLVQEQCGATMVEILRYLEVMSLDCLLHIEDLFAFFHYDSPDLLPIKKKVGITLNDGSFKVKVGLSIQANNFIQSLKTFQQQETFFSSTDLIIPAVLLDRYPILRQIVPFFVNDSPERIDTRIKFKRTLIKTIIMNHDRVKCRFSYDSCIREFASCIFILGGRNVYEFIRINIPGLLPSLTVIQALIDSSTNNLQEEIEVCFAAEDCTSVIPKITYNVQSNTFTGFTPPLKDCLPQINTFSTESFSELEHWSSTLAISNLLNVHMIQPITVASNSCSPFLLSAYGTDNRFITEDIILRWVNMVDECVKREINLVGFATDCDSRYLRSMRLLMGFFATMLNQKFHQRKNAFHVNIPPSWSWFFMRNKQLILFSQDSIHLCTKLRNRLLSSTASMMTGDHIITVDHLLQLIKSSSSKLIHNLVKSDIRPKDRQNYPSCEKISSEAALNTLSSVPYSKATQIYLQIIRNTRFAFISTETSYVDPLDRLNSSNQDIKINTKRQYFMSLPALFSMEMNSHTLVYIALLVMQHQLPEECMNISLFNSQSCERQFRLCRAMSGPFSSIVNFTVHQFIQRVKKLSYLHSIKYQNNNNSNNTDSDANLLFPKHHKHPESVQPGRNASLSSSVKSLTIEIIEESISKACSNASRLMCEVNLYQHHEIPPLDEMSRLASLQLQKLEIVESSIPGESELDMESDSDDSNSEEEIVTTEDESSDEDSILNDEVLSDNLTAVSAVTYQGMRVFDSINPNLSKSYFVININGTKKYLHMQTAVWLLSNEKPAISSDRLRRFMTNRKT